MICWELNDSSAFSIDNVSEERLAIGKNGKP
jgi:hypothetical protein